MKRVVDFRRYIRCGIVAVSFSSLAVMGGRSDFAQNVDQYDTALLRKASSASDAAREDPLILFSAPAVSSKGGILAPSSVKTALQGFLKDFPRFLAASEGSHSEEANALSGAIGSFIESPGFEAALRDAQRDRTPIELFFLSAEPLKEAKMIRDFSERFDFPLRFHSADAVSPISVALSLVNLTHAFLIRWASATGKSVYLVDPKTGSVSRRYEFQNLRA